MEQIQQFLQDLKQTEYQFVVELFDNENRYNFYKLNNDIVRQYDEKCRVGFAPIYTKRDINQIIVRCYIIFIELDLVELALVTQDNTSIHLKVSGDTLTRTSLFLEKRPYTKSHSIGKYGTDKVVDDGSSSKTIFEEMINVNLYSENKLPSLRKAYLMIINYMNDKSKLRNKKSARK